MDPTSYIPLVGSICNLFFAIFVFSQAPGARANRAYFVLGLSIAVWNFGSFRLLVETDPAMALLWAREVFVGVLIAIVAFVHLSFIIAEYDVTPWIKWLYTFEAGLVALDCTPGFVRSVVHLGSSGWYAQPGWAFPLLNVPYGVSSIAVVVLWRKRKSLPRLQRHRLSSLLVAQVLIFILGLNDLLPIYGITHYPFTGALIYPYGSLGAVFYGIIIAYSVLHHQLLDVQVALSRFAAHFIRFAFLTFLTLGLLLLAAKLSGAFTDKALALALLVFVLAALLASILFPRLFGGGGLQKLEQRILGDHFDYHDRVRSFISNMTWYADLNSLLNDLDEALTGAFGLRSYQVVLRDDATGVYSVLRIFPERPRNSLPELTAQSPVFQYLSWGNRQYLALRSHSLRSPVQSLEHEARAQLSAFDAELCFALSFQSETFGLLLIGPKTSGDPFTGTDINLFVSLVKTLGLMLNQLRLKSQIQHTQELDLLGRMSRGMAHDLNNLLTPISTLLQLGNEVGSLDDELLPVALRNVGTIRSYIREALFFSENLRPDLQVGRLDLIVCQAADVARNARNKEVEIIPACEGEILIEMDGILIQRLIANLLTNAIDASSPGSEVRVELKRLAASAENAGWVRLTVIDHGEGIPKENLSRVSTPYFTTKTHGDEHRGFGLGLAICHKIAALHHGKITIESHPKRGTTVRCDFPQRQDTAAAGRIQSTKAA